MRGQKQHESINLGKEIYKESVSKFHALGACVNLWRFLALVFHWDQETKPRARKKGQLGSEVPKPSFTFSA